MNDYLAALEGMPKLLSESLLSLDAFKKSKYSVKFQELYQRHLPVLDAMEREYVLVIDKDQFLANMAEALVAEAETRIRELKRRTQKNQEQMNLNLAMVVFVFPMILEYKGKFSVPFTEKLASRWKQVFPKEDIRAVTHTSIEEGFHRKFCYVTTAVCRTFGKPDDCYELNLFRNYRDTYMAALPDGEALIRMYYDVAPSIVKHISQRPDASQIYSSIWKEWLEPCKRSIESGDLPGCLDLYKRMVGQLKDSYFAAFTDEEISK